MKPALDSAIAAFGAKAKAKLANPGASGEPEEQLRAPFEQLLAELALLCNLPPNAVAAVGETSVSDLKTRPDYAVTVRKTLVGFVELKAPGKGADPRKFKDPHDKAQWEKLHSLWNLIYTDGNCFQSLAGRANWWVGDRLNGDIETSGNKLQTPPGLLSLFEKFFRWEPLPPRNAKELARISARLCKLLRDEVTEQLAGQRSPDRAGRGLAQAAFPRSHRRAVRGRLRAGRHVRSAHGPRQRHPAGHRA